ncbi:hypothetical protein BIV60_03280 [Bacillus sp. MUM 116]|uniref:hypothetical protein n=1 Tax=Bacillus sp. MUM 116 TaxID=1678002 RepID=UPI0008F571C4|nr:hypothetical protein [Bacillus sp. MUM 116]OIK16660.1 hypothetical protein BIV60_03280 [Bacillus sp. MUM 116]
MKKWSWLFTFLLAGILLVGCSTQKNNMNTEGTNQAKDASTKPVTALKLMENEKTGKYLADEEGRTLYYFAKDKINKTNCKGECLENWPPYYSKNFEVPKGFNKKDFGTIIRDDTGEKQTTYKGYPLYYFKKDKTSGEVNGQGVKGVWFIVNSETKFTP